MKHINDLISKLDERLDAVGTKVEVLETVANQLRENILRIEQNYASQLKKFETRFWGVFLLCITESIGILLFVLEK